MFFLSDLIPSDFIHVIRDAHVYHNHVRPLQEKLHNQPKPFPVCVMFSTSFTLYFDSFTCWPPNLLLVDFGDKSKNERYRFFCGCWFQAHRLWSSPEDWHEAGCLKSGDSHSFELFLLFEIRQVYGSVFLFRTPLDTITIIIYKRRLI